MTKHELCIAVYQNKEADVIENQNVPGWRDEPSDKSFPCKYEDMSSNP